MPASLSPVAPAEQESDRAAARNAGQGDALRNLFDRVDDIAREIAPKLIETRKRLHMRPELSWEERETSAAIQRRLTELGIPFRAGLAVGPNGGPGTGVIAEIKGARPGRTIAYRADIDALPMGDDKSAPYKSQCPGVMHACGHDAHVSIGLGLAETLFRVRDQIQGSVRILFQPAEESPPSGAPRMIADGAIDGVDAIWCVHVEPNLKAGVFGLKRGVLTAAVDMYRLKVTGRSAHSARPHLGVDAILAASRVITAIYQTIQSSIDPYTTGVLNVGMVHGGEAPNILAGSCELSGTIRSYEPELREFIPKQVDKQARAICESMGATAEFEIVDGSPAVINDLDMIDFAEKATLDAFGSSGAHHLTRPSTGGDDFSYYGERIPMCMVRAGARMGDGHGLHTTLFDVADETMPGTTRVMARAMLLHLKKLAG